MSLLSHNQRVYLGEWKEIYGHHGCTVLTPNENAAGTLGVAPLSLETFAQQILGEKRIAHPVSVQRLLVQIVDEVLESADLEGVTRILLPRSVRCSGLEPISPPTLGLRECGA